MTNSKRANSYLHTEKDPIIDVIRTLAQDQGGQKLSTEYLTQLSYESGISKHTLQSWFRGKTRRPQHITVKFVLLALGCRMAVIRTDGTEVKARK